MPQTREYELDEITETIIGCAINIHRRFGPGLLESVYEALLAQQLRRLGFDVKRQVPIALVLDGISFEETFRVDLLVENRVVVELKSIEKLSPGHTKQALTHITLMNLSVGLLINFGQETLIDGLKRIVNNLHPGDSPTLRVNQPPESE